ncbi:peptidase M16 domain protein [Gemmatirosa kalamazoonensis]|uniref:Peptidase M16 domain protein n=1 Tax=Gemmatirosa kalamazoonensis TaxID=861299 RepID=W0RHF6_9BACT|nr:M16 family metallopeptidase [Gemmatirosa kalamazoonensis]AHG90196.1 peptidase M16 domain protein [Gemmatirosa kalamazoonensis]
MFRLRLVAALLLIASATGAQPVTKDRAPSSPDAPVPLDTAVLSGRLPNGVRYLLRRNGRPEKRVALRLAVNAGSVLEDEDQRGLAHFVEHMAFNGTRRFAKQGIVDFLERSGVRFGPDLNAGTSFDETVYQLDVPSDSAKVLETAVQILADWAHGLTFDSAEVVRERGVVLEEWRQGQGAGSRIANQQRPIVLQGSRYAVRLPIGDTATIVRADAPRLRRFYDTWYRPDLMTVIAVGDADPRRLRDLVAREFSSIPAPRAPRARPTFDVPAHAAPLVSVVTDREATSTLVSVLYKQPARPLGTVRAARREIVEALADIMLNERLSEIAQRADPPYLGAGVGGGQWVRSAELFSASARVRDDGVLRGLAAVLTEVERVRRTGFTASELDRARRNLLRAFEQQYAERDKTSSDALVSRLVDYALTGDPLPSPAWEWAEAQRVVPAVTLADVNASLAARLDGASRVITVQGPESARGAMPTREQLLAVFDQVSGATLAAYADSASDVPLVPTMPTAGRITAARTIPELGVTEWTLSNGARVLLKPTDFKADEVLFQAFGPGGVSAVGDTDYVAASLAAQIVPQGGLGAFDRIALQKRLAGTAATVSPFIGSRWQGLVGSSSPKDLRTMFELAYLTLTAPRADSTAYAAVRARLDAFLATRGNSPQAVFQDTVMVTMAQHHPHARPLTPALVREIDLPRAMRVYRDRFAGAGGFTYVLVGAFQPDSVRPLVEQYVASLPAPSRPDSARDDGMRPPTGVVERTVRKGLEPRASTQLVFTGPMQYSRAEHVALGALGEVLEIRLRERIREALSGTYGVGVSASAQRVPWPSYQLAIGFTSAPDRADELTTAVLQELDSMRTKGPTADEIQKVRETGLRELETAEKQNRWWLGSLAEAVQSGEDPRTIVDGREQLARLTPALVQEAARKYLNAANYAHFTLMPEKP